VDTADLDRLTITTIRTLSIDGVQKANSGHPGAPMGLAPVAYALYGRVMRHDPSEPEWMDRDRFVLSAGHASMLLYSTLHVFGYGVSIDDLKSFRQWGSHTPGHPEYSDTPGIDTTTGPLGQGMGNGVGFALAERMLNARYGDVIDHRTWVIASDGDMMEGISHEAGSVAGDLRLGRLNVIYDDNHISLSGPTSMTFSEDVPTRFTSYGWHTAVVDDGNDIEEIEAALRAAAEETERPSLIAVRTHIGFGSPHLQDTFKAHGEPLGEDEVRATKEAYGWDPDAHFLVPDEVYAHTKQLTERGRTARSEWDERMQKWRSADPEAATEWDRVMARRLPDGWEDAVPVFDPDPKGQATRASGGDVLNALAGVMPEIVGGSADLDPSTKTHLGKDGNIAAGSYAGRNIQFGVREHVMGAMTNGIALHGGFRPFCATFFMFYDYMKNPVRLAALMRQPAVFVYTHDSIGLGEDGPTHQPIENLAALRAVPGLYPFRPGDANETAEAWKAAISRTDGPSVLVLSRQNLPVVDREKYGKADGVRRGGYVLKDGTDAIIIATGSEVGLALEAAERLDADGISTRVVSMPCPRLFDEQGRGYFEEVLPPSITRRVSVEAASTWGWDRYVGLAGATIGLERFGASAPGPEVMKQLGFSVDNVVATVKGLG
jgi:transketolase